MCGNRGKGVFECTDDGAFKPTYPVKRLFNRPQSGKTASPSEKVPVYRPQSGKTASPGRKRSSTEQSTGDRSCSDVSKFRKRPTSRWMLPHRGFHKGASAPFGVLSPRIFRRGVSGAFPFKPDCLLFAQAKSKAPPARSTKLMMGCQPTTKPQIQ